MDNVSRSGETPSLSMPRITSTTPTAKTERNNQLYILKKKCNHIFPTCLELCAIYSLSFAENVNQIHLTDLTTGSLITTLVVFLSKMKPLKEL